MYYPNVPQLVEYGVGAAAPAGWFGPDAPDGDATPFVQAPIGSRYIHVASAYHVAEYVKAVNNGRDDDWVVLSGCITERITRAQFTDGGAAIGTKALATQIPIGATVSRCYLLDVTGFSGNTSAVMIIGDGTDTDRYMTGTPDVFTTAAAIDLGAVSGVACHVAAKTVTVTVTSAADFTAVTAGAATVRIFYTK